MKISNPVNRVIHTAMCSVYDSGINESYEKVSHISNWRSMNHLVRDKVRIAVLPITRTINILQQDITNILQQDITNTSQQKTEQ